MSEVYQGRRVCFDCAHPLPHGRCTGVMKVNWQSYRCPCECVGAYVKLFPSDEQQQRLGVRNGDLLPIWKGDKPVVVVCGECSDTTWFIQPGYGAWLISCSNGHKLIPTGGTEYVIDQSSQLSAMRSADQTGPAHRDHPSGGQADRDTSVLPPPETWEQSESGSYGSEGGKGNKVSEKVTVGLQIWEEMNRNYRSALRERDAAREEEKKRRLELSQARAEIDRQRARANRSQNEAQARASELRQMGYELRNLQARNENQFEQIQNLLVEKRERQKLPPPPDNRLKMEELQDEVDSFRGRIGKLDRVLGLVSTLQPVLEELLLDE